MTQSKDDKTFDLDDITLSISDDYLTDSNTITIDMNDYSMSDYTVDTVDISSITTSTIDNDLTVSGTTWDSLTNITFDRVMFEDDMPDPQTLKQMCEEYPALEKVYENFKTVYKLVEQDWKGKQDDDDPLPF